MAYTNYKITAPVNETDIRKALGVGSGDIGTLCRSNNINMWSKFKPVCKAMRNTNIQLNLDKTWKPINGSGGLGTDAWYLGTNLDFGITALSESYMATWGPDRMISALEKIANNRRPNGGINGWTYTRPSGIATEPYRPLDFIGYNSNAPRPVKKASGLPVVEATTDSGWEYGVQIMGSVANDLSLNVDDRDYLLAKDIIGTCYFGIAIYRKENDGLRDVYRAMAWVTSNAWEGEGIATSGTGGITDKDEYYVQAQFADGNTYYALPLFFSEQLPQEQTVAGNVLPYPNWSKQPMSNGKVWTIPYTDFVPFVARHALTAQKFGYPCIDNKTILPPVGSSNTGAFATRVYIDSSYSSYYDGGTISDLWIGVVNESWSGVWSVGDTANAHIVYLSNVEIHRNTKEQVYYWGSGGDHVALLLDTNHTWRVIIKINGEEKPIALYTTANKEI